MKHLKCTFYITIVLTTECLSVYPYVVATLLENLEVENFELSGFWKTWKSLGIAQVNFQKKNFSSCLWENLLFIKKKVISTI